MRLRAAVALAAVLAGWPVLGAPPAPKPAAAVVATNPLQTARTVVGLRVGGLFPSAYNKLNTSFIFELELGYQLPVLSRRLGIFLDGSYTQPKASGTTADPRLPGGSASWNLTFQDIGIAAGVQYLHPIADQFLLYGGLGPKLHFIRSTQTATSASAAMGENSERSARLGLLLRAGAGLFLGRGALVLELHQEFLNSNHAITDYHNVANFSAMAGYVLLI